MKLYVDDCRSVPEGWVLARTVEEAIAQLQEGSVEELSLDYMIGDRADHNFAAVARFVVSLPPEKRPAHVRLHTSSPFGAREMERILTGHVDRVTNPFSV